MLGAGVLFQVRGEDQRANSGDEVLGEGVSQPPFHQLGVMQAPQQGLKWSPGCKKVS